MQHYERSMDPTALASYISSQLNTFFPDKNPIQHAEVLKAITLADERIYHCFSNIHKKYFNEQGVTTFNHLQGDQYCMFLYMLSNAYFAQTGEVHLPTKLYLLNKALHAVDIYFTTVLPEIFLLVHPVGTIIGRAQFADYFIAYQGVTVGCLNSGVFPTFKGAAIAYANSSILGECTIGENVCIAAGARLINETIADNSIVLGQSPNLSCTPNRKPMALRPPFYYGN